MKFSHIFSFLFAIALTSQTTFGAFFTPTKSDLNAQKLTESRSGFDQISTVIPNSFHKLIEQCADTDEKKFQLRHIATNLWGASNHNDEPTVILTGSMAIAYWALTYNCPFRQPNDVDLAVSNLSMSESFYPTEFFREGQVGKSKFSHITYGKENYFNTDLILLNSALGFVYTDDLTTDPETSLMVPVLPPAQLLETKKQKLQEQKSMKANSEKTEETEEDIDYLESILAKIEEKQRVLIDSDLPDGDDEEKQAPVYEQRPVARKLNFDF